MVEVFLTSPVFAFVVLPFMIFCARICDLTLGNIRVIFIWKGIKYLAPFIGFFEVIIWLLAIGQVMNNLTNIVRVYRLWSRVCSRDLYRYGDRRKISLGLTSVRIITRDDPADLMHYLRTHDYGVTSIDGEGATGKVKMVFTIIKRQDLPQVINIIKQSNPSAFYSVEEVKSVAEGVFPFRRSRGVFSWMDSLRFYRKGKWFLPVHENESQMKFDPAV